MNKVFSILFALFVSVSYGQIADYFESDQVWLQSSSCIQGSEDCVLNTNFTYYVDGDTDVVVTGELYHIIRENGLSEYQALDSSVSGICEGEFKVNHIAALLRQEERKIYMFDMNDEQEYLLYDFSLIEGDTLPVTPIQPLANVIVEEVDSFSIGTAYLKKLYITTPETPYIIEGVGSNFGFLEDMVYDIECTYSHGCYSRNGETIWSKEGSTFECDYSVSIEQTQLEDIQLFPNPAKERLFIDGMNNGDVTFEIYDLSGRTIFTDKLNSNSIDISEFDTGNYILRLNRDGEVLTKRFVKSY